MSSVFTELEVALDKMAEKFPEKQKKLMEQAGEKLHRKVLQNIDTDTKQYTGNLRKGCEKHIGSGGGYAAVRNNHLRAPHAHLVEEGHNMMKQGKQVWQPGKHMYRNALNELEEELMRDAERMMDEAIRESFG